ncbi:acyl-CoA dehydrogenase family protein [Polaromonas sp. YR568]|uniref:acyl-CoA dehydrogenase family protein n=1 Tax=Polaromonas sp. YR568 TaxID=1855301 RepID=UPI00398BEB58
MTHTSSTLEISPAAEAATAGPPLHPASEKLAALLDSIREGASNRDLERELPFGVIESLRQARLGAIRIPKDEGGLGVSLRELFAVVIRLGEADSNVAHILRNHFVTLERILSAPRSERNRRWIKAAAEGAIFSLAGTELGAKRSGSLSVVSTRLSLQADGAYRLDGEKYYSTGCLYADYIAIPVLTPQGETATVIIPAARTGVELVDDWDGFGQRLTGTGTTRLHEVRVEADELIQGSDSDTSPFHYISTIPQLYVTAINAGVAQSVLRDATALVHKRPRSFYHATAEKSSDDPLVQHTIGQIAANAFAAESIVLAASDALDVFIGEDGSNEAGYQKASLEAALKAAKAKLVVDELALRSATLLFEVGGASSARRSENLDRHWRNARTLAAHNPAAFKARALGDYELNQKAPPNLGFF